MSTPPGWYADPNQPGQQRYWDGNAWTEHVAPAGGPPTGAPPAGGFGPPGAGFQTVGQRTPGKATAALVLGIVGIFLCPLVCSVLAIIFGVQARNEIDANPTALGGRGQAQAGFILGIVGIALTVIWIVIFAATA